MTAEYRNICTRRRTKNPIEKRIEMLSKMLLVVAFVLSIGSCVAFQAQGQNLNGNALLKGRYWFHSRGVGNMFESGVMTFDGNGFFTLHSMYISDTQNHSINTAGHYLINQFGTGTAKQGACLASDLSCSPVDYEAVFVSSDGQKAMMVSMEGHGAGWQLEMSRDPETSYPYNLRTCDARSGTVQGCYDGYTIPQEFYGMQ